jgi:pseudaminic acid cytidylyltransferase
MANLAIIPARGGSKRIPGKNIRAFLGRPILSYSVEAAQQSGLFKAVMVSTDSAEVAAVAQQSGAEVPFYRSEATANDTAPLAAVVSEVLQEYAQRGQTFTNICVLLPTAPFVTVDDLSRSYVMLADNDCNSVVPVVPFSFPIQRAFRLEDGLLRMMWPEHMLTRSQDLPKAFHDAGLFYWLRADAFLDTGAIYTDRSAGYFLKEHQAQDIDTPEDWELAELKYKILAQSAGSSHGE